MRRLFAVLILMIATPTSAQVFSNSVIMGMGYTAQAAVSQQPVLHCLRTPCPRHRSPQQGRVISTSPVALAFARGPAPVFNGDVSLKYTPSVELSQQARSDFLSRLRSNNVEAANAVDAESRRFNFAKIASDLLGSVGLHNDDAADALTFYTVLGYLIANNDMSDPSPAMFKGVRNQIAPRLAADPRFRSPAARAKLGEELKFLTVILHAG